MTSLNFRKINIEAYKPGRSILKKKKNVIKLSANESQSVEDITKQKL